MSFIRRNRSATPAAPKQATAPCMIEHLENRALFSASLKVISLTPPTTKPATHVKAPKVPKAVKVGVTPKKAKATVSSSSGEKHVDYGTSQFGV